MRYALLSLLLCSSLGGCADLGFDVRTLTDLERAQRRWERWRPDSYVYSIERLCFCPIEYRGPVRVRVDGDDVVERTYIDTGQPVPAALADGFPAVDGLFVILASAFDEDAHEVRVSYDPESGVPVDFWIDYDEMMADEELGFRVTEEVEAAGAP